MFVLYLKTYFKDYKKPLEASSKQQLDPRYKCLSLTSTANSEDLGQMFSEFPLEYQGVLPIDTEKTAKWTRALDFLIQKTESAEGALNFPEEVQAEIKNMISAIISDGCEELFDPYGRLQAEIINILGLPRNNLLSSEINYQLLYSYCNQIYFQKILSDWMQNFYQSYLKKGQDVRLLGEITRFVDGLFVGRDASWTDFFISEIKNRKTSVFKYFGLFADTGFDPIKPAEYSPPKPRFK
ncbi:MAG TPA: hypothetical protein VLI69_07530 [Gammaproteobacteria bacterium]|nr:hypothetical protein [Gammaproteobacteria bacterium]